jgi:rRNA maturation RNase YbeY
VKKKPKVAAKPRNVVTVQTNSVRPRRWKIHLSAHSKALKIPPAEIRSLLSKILRCVEAEIAPKNVSEIHLLLVNDARMREINFEFRKKDKPTDVLSFPQFTPQEMRGEKPVGDEAGSYVGDLVISTETTIKQAKRFKVSLKAEVTRLLVHGVLHLCGYDHEKVPAREAQRMRRRERAIRGML